MAWRPLMGWPGRSITRFFVLLLLGFGLIRSGLLWAAEGHALLLANVYRGQVAVRDYLVSEKLDGVRAVWDGQTLRFRSGLPVPAPTWFTAALPAQPLDGELWLGRGRFEEVAGLVRRDPPDEAAWRAVRYMIFELPGAPGTFRERAAAIKTLVATVNVPWLAEIEQISWVDRESLQAHFQAVIQAGGEGLMLHRADALYETGRSDVLLKMKVAEDAEAIVVGYRPGKGKYAGQVGALRVRMPDGREFFLGSGLTDAMRQTPPPLGTSVTYRYRDLTGKGLPRFPTFLRVRHEP